MNWESPFFITLISCGICFVVIGWVFQKWPPKSINAWYGYRSKRSMSSQEAWDFSQPMAASLMIQNGILMTLLSFAGLFVSFNQIAETGVSLVVLVLACVLLGVKVEGELKTRFP